MGTESKRLEWIDLMRVIAIILVVLCHSVEGGVYFFHLDALAEVSTASRVFAFNIFTFSRLASCLFLMISGYLLLDRVYDKETIFRFWKKSWLHLVICTVFWFLIYDLFLMFFYGMKISVGTILLDLIFFHPVNMMNAWYMPVVIGIYVLIPFAAIVLSRVDSDLLVFPAIFYCVFAFGFPLLNTVITILGHSPFPEQVSLGFSGGVYCFYMICGYMVKKGYFKSIRTYWLVIIIICSILAGTGIQLWAYSNGVLYTIWRDNPFILFASVAFFEAFSRIGHIKHASIFRRLASYSFGVYLVHVLIRAVTIDYVLHMAVVRPVRLLILWIITVVFSYLISWLISLIPKVGNYIIYRK